MLTRILLLASLGFAACGDLAGASKTGCVTDADCLDGLICRSDTCVEAGTNTSDPEGDVACLPNGSTVDFIDLIDGTLEVDATSLTVTITVKDLPESLTFNQDAVASTALEYQWEARIDVDDDGTEDYGLSISHFKSGDEQSGAILANTQHDLTQMNGASRTRIAGIDAVAIGQTFTLVAQRSLDPGLDAIDASSKVTFGTYFGDGSSVCTDSL
ncbi:MAG: hypothetical protein H6729_09710 [Deltaproteobacteria bacterium]|nr:hypothetical protein [Deltaproteobacteria bacterium]